MKNIFAFTSFLFITFIFSSSPAFGQTHMPQIPKQDFSKATVIQIIQEGYQDIAGYTNAYQRLEVKILEGKDTGKKLIIQNGGSTSLTASQKLHSGDTIIVTHTQGPTGNIQYMVYDTFRLTPIYGIAFAFIVLVLLVAGWKGFGSLIGLLVSLTIIFFYIVPQILSGADPLTISIIGSLGILLITTYLAHGISEQTTVALIATFLALMLCAELASLFVHLVHLSGLNDETATLQFGPTRQINLQGLLLGGIIIGTLGALNDVTTTQAATVFSLAKHSVEMSFKKLFVSSFSVGREHIASMINTLVLAYAGSSLTLFLILILNPQKIPLWVMINNEDISDEIIRTLAGSMGLILVVPIVTFLATVVAIWLRNSNNRKSIA